jgi:hypothetical protein
VKFTFPPGRLGVYINPVTDCVEKVERGGKAERIGIQPGLKFKLIEDKPYTANLLENKARGQSPYEVTLVKVSRGGLPVAAGNQEFTL